MVVKVVKVAKIRGVVKVAIWRWLVGGGWGKSEEGRQEYKGMQLHLIYDEREATTVELSDIMISLKDEDMIDMMKS